MIQVVNHLIAQYFALRLLLVLSVLLAASLLFVLSAVLAPSLYSAFYTRQGRWVDRVRRQSMPSNSMAHCAVLNKTLPVAASGQTK